MTKKQFLARMGNAWDMGLCTPESLRLADFWVDSVMRFEGGQLDHWMEFLEAEKIRLQYFASNQVLANDKLGYGIIQLLAIMNHPCQLCAEDPKAWHTRSAFCNHKNP